MIVVHTANVDVEDGLTNGATGVVKHVDFRWMEGTNRPSIIWVLFDDPRVGKATREKKTKNSTTQAFIQTGWSMSQYRKFWGSVPSGLNKPPYDFHVGLCL